MQDLQRDGPARLVLLCLVHCGHAAGRDEMEHAEGSDLRPDEVVGQIHGPAQIGRRARARVEEFIVGRVRGEHALQVGPQHVIALESLEQLRTFLGRRFERGLKERHQPFEVGRRHRCSPLSICTRSHARADDQSRKTVRGTTSSRAAISSTVSPAK